MTIPEQGAKVVTSTVEALKGNPGLLVLVLLQIVTMGTLFFVTDKQNERRATREMYILQHCFDGKTGSIFPTE